MFFHDAVYRRLVSLLRPWLQEEPEIELQLGFINSELTAKKLKFDVSALNNESESSRFQFKEVTVDHLSFRFSNWSSPACKIGIRGVNITLLAGEVKEEGSLRRARKLSEEKKKAVAGFDPEGSALHDVLERILLNPPSRNWFKTSLLNLVLKHCHLQISDTNLQVQFPDLNDAVVFLLELKDFNGESEHSDPGCLLRGVVGAVFKPLKVVSFVMDFRGFGFAYKMEDQINHISSFTDLLSCIKLNDLRVADFNIRVPKLSLLFSPLDLLVLSAFGKLSTKERKHVRSGRQLWKLAANRLGYVPSSPRLSLHKLVDFICLWLRYQNAYEYLLSLLGYSADNLLKKSVIKLSEDKMFLNSVKHNWGEISGIEKELPAEAIAQARRIARYRAVSNIQNGKNSFKESSMDKQVNVFSKILSVFIVIWNVMYKILLSILHCFFFIILLFQRPKLDWNPGNNSEDYSSRYCFLLNFGKILVTFSSTSKHKNVDERIESHTGISYSDIHSFCLSIHMLLLAYVDEVFEQSLSLSCGKLKVKSSSVMETAFVDRSVKNPFSSKKVRRKGSVDKLKTILMGKPAQVFLPSQTSETSVANPAEGTCNPYLQTLLGEMWLAWQKSSAGYKDNEIAYSETPWLLCEIKNCLMDPNLKRPVSGFWKCSLTAGKLNLALGYSSVLSLAILLGQIQHALNLNENTGRATVPLNFPPTIENQEEISWEDKYELYSNRLKLTFLRMLPEKHIELGVFVTGPCIEMTPRKVGLNSGDKDTNQDDFQLGFDIQNIEVVVWPTSKSDLALTGWSESDGAEPESHKLREPQIIEIPKPDNEKYASEGWISLGSYFKISGFDIYKGNSAEREQNQIFSMKPIAARLSFFREFVYTFSTTVIAFSTTFSVTASGFHIISYMDELYVLFQVVAGLLSTVSLSYAFRSFDISGFMPLQNFVRQNMVFNELENDEISAEGAALICNSTLVSTTGTFNFKPMDVILQNSRIDDKEGSSVKTYAAMSNQMAGHDLPDCGILISVHQTHAEVSLEEHKLKILCDLQGIQFVISRYPDHMLKSFDHSVVRNLLQQTEGGLYEIFLSDFTFTFWLGQPHNSLNNSVGKTSSSGNTSQTVDNAHLISECETSTAQSSRFTQKSDFATDITASSPSQWILVNVTLGIIFVAKGSLKNSLVGPNQFNKLTALLEVGRNLQTFSWGIKGGVLVLETAALTMFFRCVVSYLQRIKHLLSIISSSVKQAENAENEAQETLHMTRQTKWEWLEASTIDVSQFSLTLVVEDGSGGFQELVIEVDVHMKFESAILLRKFIFNLSRMVIFSQVHRNYVENENHGSHQSKMLNNLVASISAEKHENDHKSNQVWVGMGSISDFEMTISLSEIQMILSMVSSFSSASNKEIGSDLKRRRLSSNQEPDNCLKAMVPDGAIVAIQDVHQHLYFAVEERENKYSLFGVMHHSLVGEKALFRVKHHKQGMWKSSVLWFSLISLHAKNNVGEPLRLNYHSGSGFVGISSANDSGWSLWRILPCEPESYNSDIDWEPYNKLVKDTFYLVNKKSDSAVAFVDGVPLFVKKPGHPFKFKVCNQFPWTHEDAGRISGQCRSLPCLQIKIDHVSVTIVHELLDTRDRFPLLRGCISNTELNLQILYYKTRVMSTSIALLDYFDAQKNLWRELVHPLEICTFYRSVFHIQDSETVQHGAPVHFYCRSKELDISLTELSLDVLLFVIGKLQLAGPFSSRSSMILSNSCKVENQTGLSLICHFYNKKSVTIARKQSASVSLSQILANQPPESKSLVTIQLSDLGSFATSSLDISILETRVLAWRTSIVSLQDSRTYPGPFVVVETSRKSEDGLSISVSPLIRIHNETEFSMELCFRRSQQDEDVFAPILLKKGSSVDDSMKVFEAIGSSGGLKKALMSFTVGNFLFSFRPEITDDLINSKSPLSAEWSDELKGGKAVFLSGIFDKLSYKVRKALSVDTIKCSFSTAACTLKSGDAHATNLHFLIQSIGRDVPIIQPDKSSGSSDMTSAVALQEQKEIFILPTVRVSNLLHSEIHVLLTEKGLCTTVGSDSFGKQAAIPRGSTVDFYANPAILYFTVTLTAFSMSCKPVNSGDWVKKLLKNKNKVHFLDIDLEFGGGKYFASLRLSRGYRGILEVSVFTQYSLKNDTEFSLFMFAPHQKPLSRDEVRRFGSTIPPDLGLFSPPNSIRSWFLKSHKTRLKLLEDSASEALLDLDALSGLTEISLDKEEGSGEKSIVKFGVSVGPSSSSVMVPSQIVTMVPRHVVFNESEEHITVRQYYLEKDEVTSLVHINSKQRTALKLWNGISERKEFSLFENFIRKHRNDIDTSLVYIQFRLNEPESSWSGPVCIVSLGRFFIKFRKQSNQDQALDNSAFEFAAIHVVEEGSTVGVHFHKPPNVTLPYRIENHLHDLSLTFCQKDSSEREILGSGCSAYYVWDDLTLPRKLVVLINEPPEVSPTMESSTSLIPPVSNSHSSEFSSVVPHLPDISIKLASTNYLLWKAQVIPILRGNGLLSYVQNQVSCPSQTITGEDGVSRTNPAAAMWLRTDQLILGWINSSLSDGPLSQVISSETSHDAWHVLQTLYGSHTRDRLQQMKSELQSLNKGSSSLEDYLHKAKSLALSLRGAGKPMDDDEFIICILRGLGSEFDPIVAALNARDVFPPLEGVIGKLRDFEIRLQATRVTSPNVAFFTNRGRTSTRFRGTHSSRGRNITHNQTPSQFHQKDARLPRFTKGNPGTRTQTFTNRGGRSAGRGRGGITCFRCGGPNHKADGCFASDEEAEQFKAFAALQVADPTEETWYPDTGANNHMTADTSEVQGIHSYLGNDSVMVGNGNGLQISGIGQVSLPTTDIKLNNVLVVPDIKKKLLSVSQLTKEHNCYFIFYSWGFLLKDMRTKQVLLKGYMVDGLYPIQLRQHTKSPVGLLSTKVSSSLWHARLGHPQSRILQLLRLSSLNNTVGFCESCVLGKSTKLPFCSRKTYATTFLHTLHTDVWGPASIPSYDGFRFYLIIVDEYSRYIWHFPMARKSDVITIFPAFLQQMANQFNTTVKIIQSDGGGEFVNQSLQDCFVSNGIIHRLSCPGTPEQNGLAERRHRHIVDTGLTLMAHASIPPRFWTAAFTTAVFLINRLPTPTLGNKSPCELVFGSPPSYTLLRVFGCACYPLLNPFGRSKLDYKSVSCVFLGYSTHHKGYQCLNMQTGRIYISRHVKFDELTFPFRSTQRCTISDFHEFKVRALPRSLQIATVQSIPMDSLPAVVNLVGHEQSSSPPIHNSALMPHSPPCQEPPPNTVIQDAPELSSLPTAIISHSAPRRRHSMITRAQTGSLKPKTFFSSRHPIPACFLADFENHPQEPQTYKQALTDPKWQQAMHAEITALASNNTWTLVPRRSDMNLVSSKWVFKIKTRSDGSIERYKARLVARGFTQLPGLDYDETFSPVVKHGTIRLILTLGLSHGWSIKQLDVSNAFLHGDLQERVYLSQPPGFEDSSHPHHVCHLHKALYGLKQAPRAWYMKFSAYIQQMGFHRCPYDQSLFTHRQGSDITLLLIYVDDILITGSSPSSIRSFISHLSAAFHMKDLGDAHFFLGLQITRDESTITVTQTRYLLSLLQKFGLAGAKPVSTPMASGTSLTAGEGTLLSDSTYYRRLVGSLQYLTLTRPDISYAVHNVCQFMHHPRDSHLIAVKRVFRYLKGTLNTGLHFVKTPPIALRGFCDADWAGSRDDRRSTTGFAIYMGDNLLSWGAKKQATVSRSTAEAEYRALASTTAELMWFIHLLKSIGYLLPAPTLYCDNLSAITMAKNPVFHHRTKHIEIDVHFVREQVARGSLSLQHISGPAQIADIFTKPLCAAKFLPNRTKLFIGPIPP